MVGATVIGTSLVLLCLTRPGVSGAGTRIFDATAYDLTYPCEGDFGEVCLYMWAIGGHRAVGYIAVVSNGELQKAGLDHNCAMQIPDLTEEDVGHHHCRQRNGALSSRLAPELNLLPNKTASLQCVFLPYVETGGCYARQRQRVSLTWVDGAGTAIQEDAQHQIKRQSACKATLTVSLQRAESEAFRCEAAVDDHTQTSLAFTVGAPGLKKRGRGFHIETANQGGSRQVAGVAAGVGACVVLTAAVAVFVMNKRRKERKSQLPEEPSSIQHTSNTEVLSTGDVTYAAICFSAGSGRVQLHECESTEYACIRYN